MFNHLQLFKNSPSGKIASLFLAGTLSMSTAMTTQAESSFNESRKTEQETVGANGMVTGTTGAPAQQIGLGILKQGGNAMDAAMATALAQITLAGGAWVSFAGILGMTYYDAETGKVYDLNAEYNSVKNETDPTSIPTQNLSLGLQSSTDAKRHLSGRAVLVPGFMAGVDAGLKRFGKLPMTDVFAPAIQLAQEGFQATDGFNNMIAFRKDVLSHWPETRQIFQHADGSWLKGGDLFKQPELAKTLTKVAHQGAQYMYTGDWGQKFVKMVQADGGKITMDDMKNYRAIWTEPLAGSYHGYDIMMHGLPSNGGLMLLEALNTVEASNLKEMGHYTKNPDSLYYLSQIMRNMLFSFKPIVDADGKPLSPEQRISKAHGEHLWNTIKTLETPLLPVDATYAPRHSDAVVVVDQWGNIAAMTHSINTVTWGEYGRFVDGVSIPDSASFQQAALAHIEPGERLPAPLEPGIVLKDGKAIMGFAPIGAGLHQRTVTSLINVLDYNMTPQEAINQPSIGSTAFSEVFGQSAPGRQSVGVGEFDKAFLEKATRNGISYFEDDSLKGYWVGVKKDPDTGKLYGGTLRRFNGRAVGY